MSFPSGSILITGANGLLGSEFRKLLNTANVHAFSKEELDITDDAQVQKTLFRLDPDLVINTAAFTNVDGAEKNPHVAHAVNAKGVRNIVRALSGTNAKLVHFSTDQVFDGEKDTPWMETDTPSPVNFYGKSKLAGEYEALKHPNTLILRVQWLYGDKTPRFLHLKDRDAWKSITDQVGAPTYAKDIVDTTLDLIRKDTKGLFHFAYDDYASWHEIFSFVKEQKGYSVELVPAKTNELSLPAKRPLNARLSNEKLRTELGTESLGNWKKSLQTFLDS